MARTDYGAILSTVIKDTSDAIRTRTGSNALIAPANWDREILKMEALKRKTATGGSIVTFNTDIGGAELENVIANITPIQEGSGDPSPINIRPINGVSSVDTTRTGKNLSTAPLVYATASSSTQVTEDGKSCTRFTCSATKTYTGVRFKPNTQYTVKFNAKTVKSGTPTVNSGAFVFFYSDNTYTVKYVGKEDTSWTDYTLTSTSGKTVVSIGTLSTDWRLLVYVDNDTFQLEEGSTATEYEPYTGQTATINLGGTYYGGYVNVTTGLLTVTHGFKVCNGSENWDKHGSIASWFFCDNLLTNAYTNNSENDFVISNMGVQSKYSNVISMTNSYFALGENNRFVFKNTNYTTIEDFEDWLSNNNLQICYELATPQTYQLTPAQLTQLLGENNVWCDSGDMGDLTYFVTNAEGSGTMTLGYTKETLSASSDRVRTIWTRTITEDMKLGLQGTGFTDTSNSDGKFVLFKNGTEVDEFNMEYEVTTPFDFGVIDVSANDVLEIKTDWSGTHYSCRWILELFYSELA